MKQEYNIHYPLPDTPVSIDELTRFQRIVLYEYGFFVVSDMRAAESKAARLERDYTILSPTEASEKFPQFFSKTKRMKHVTKPHPVSIRMSEAQISFCMRKGEGRIAPYVCSLIDNEMKHDKLLHELKEVAENDPYVTNKLKKIADKKNEQK